VNVKVSSSHRSIGSCCVYYGKRQSKNTLIQLLKVPEIKIESGRVESRGESERKFFPRLERENITVWLDVMAKLIIYKLCFEN